MKTMRGYRRTRRFSRRRTRRRRRIGRTVGVREACAAVICGVQKHLRAVLRHAASGEVRETARFLLEKNTVGEYFINFAKRGSGMQKYVMEGGGYGASDRSMV